MGEITHLNEVLAPMKPSPSSLPMGTNAHSEATQAATGPGRQQDVGRRRRSARQRLLRLMLLALAQQGVTMVDVGAASSAVFKATTAAVGALLLPQAAQAQVRDDRIVMPSSLRISEQNATIRYVNIRFSEKPKGPVRISVTASDELDFRYNERTYDPDKSPYWPNHMGFGVSAARDNDQTGESTDVPVTFGFDGGGYDETRTVIITIVDNDEVNLVVSPSSLRIKEGESASYGLSLTRQPTSDVTVDIDKMGNGANLRRSSVTFTPGRWKNPQFVPVVTAQDSNRGDKTVTLTHRVTSGRLANGASKNPVVVTVVDDEPGVRLSKNRIEVEERKTGTYAVVLHTKPTGPVTVTVTPSSNDTRVATVSGALTFTTGDWNDAQMVTVTGKEDHTLGGRDRYTTVSHQVRGYGNVREVGRVNVTVKDRILPDLEISGSPLTVGEGESDTYTVKLKTQPTGSVTVTLSSDDTGAASVSPLELTFTTSNWETAQTVTVTGVQDADAENEELPVSHTASGANYNSLVPRYVTVIVEDPDTAGVTVSPTALTVREGESNTYTVVLDTEPTGEVTVELSSDDEDKASVSPLELTFTTGDWNDAQTVTVSGETDPDANDERVTVSHTASGADYDDVDVEDVTVTVEDPDTAGVTVSPTALTVREGESNTYTVKLDTEPAGDVTVTPSSNDTGAATVSGALTFTTSNWETPQTVTVSGEQDNDAKNEEVTLSHQVSGYGSVTTADPVKVEVIDPDTAGVTVSQAALTVREGESNTYTVKLDTEPAGDVTVTPSSNDTGAATVSGALTFTTSNWETPQTVTVSGEQDNDAKNEEVTLSHQVSGYGSVTTADPVKVEVIDPDTAGVTVSQAALTVREGESNTYTVKLDTEPAGDVTVTPSSNDTGAATVSGALTFTTSNWETPQTVTVSGEQDNDAKNEEVTLSHQVSGYGSVTTADPVKVEVIDPDTAGVTVSQAALTVREGESNTYTVKLDTEPAGDVTVTPSSNDTGAATVSGALTFTTSNWETPQTVTVSGEQDNDAKNEEVTLSHQVSGYGSVTTADPVKVEVIDPDTAGVTVSQAALTVREGASNTYTVKLKTQPVGGNVTVTPRSTNTVAATVSPLELTFTTSDWEIPKTVTVSGKQENQGVLVTHTASGADYNDVDIDNVTVTVDSPVIPQPTNLRPEAGNGQVTLTWDALPTGVPVNRWRIDYRKINASSWENDSASSTSTRTTVTDLENNFRYQFRIRAIHQRTKSPWSATVTAMPVPTRVTLSSSNPLLVTEGGSESYKVSLNNAQPRGNVIVRIESGDEGAATVSPEVLTFATSDWETAQRVTVTGKTDPDANDETVRVSHTVEGDDVVGPGSLTVKVTDDDTPEVEISSHELTVDEGGSNTYTVVLKTQPKDRVWVSLDDSDDEKDVVTISDDLLKFDASNWNIKQTVTITAKEDDDARNDSVTVIHEVIGYDSEDPDPVNVMVKDNEPAPAKPENLAARSGNTEVVLTWNNANDASITVWQVRYTNSSAGGSPNWKDIPDSDAATTTHKVTGLDNGTEYQFYIRAKNGAGEGAVAEQRGTPVAPVPLPQVIIPSMRIVESSIESPTASVSSENMTYMVIQLLQTPTSDVTVNVTSLSNYLIVPDSELKKTLTIDNWNSNGSVAIPMYALNDNKEENVNGSLLVVVSGGGYGFSDIVTVEIIDNDTSNVVVSRADLSIKEGKSASYEVSLSKEPTGNVVVTINENPSENDVSLSSARWSLSPMRLIFTTADWNVPQTVTVTASADNDGSDDKVTLNHSALGGGYDNVTGGSVVVTVKEDSSLLSPQSMLSLRPTAVAAGVTITPKELTVEEAKGDGHTAIYTVVLNSLPTGDVTVTATSADPQAAAVLAASRALTFTMMNWSTPQTVTVSGVADVDNAHETVTVSHGVSGANYEDVTADSVTVTVVDAEAAAQDAAQANKARAADLAATSRTLLGMATDVLSARRGDSAMGGGDEAASIGEQASVIMENLLRGGGDLAADIDLDGVEDRLWSQSFEISAPANDDGGLDRQGRWSLWGAGELRSYSGEAEENISYSGNLKTAWLGVDYPFTDQWLAGLAVSTSSGQSDYSYQKTDGSTDGGKMENRLTTFYPYGSFQVSEQFRLWGMAGFGFGRQKHQPNDEEGDTAEGDLRIQMGALGFEQQLHSLGALQLSLAGDVGFARSTTTWEAGSDLGNLDVSISRARLGLEASFPLGQHTTGRVGVKGRLDGGELEMGAAEVLAGLHYQAGRFSGSLQGKQVYGFDGSYRESGLAAQLRFTARPDGGGLAWELEPSYGTGVGDFALAGGQALWTDEQLEELTGHSSRDGEMEISSRVGYGIHLQEGELLLTPFTELSLYQGGSRSLGLGLALETLSWDLELSASTETNGSASPTNKLQLTFSKKL